MKHNLLLLNLANLTNTNLEKNFNTKDLRTTSNIFNVLNHNFCTMVRDFYSDKNKFKDTDKGYQIIELKNILDIYNKEEAVLKQEIEFINRIKHNAILYYECLDLFNENYLSIRLNELTVSKKNIKDKITMYDIINLEDQLKTNNEKYIKNMYKIYK